MITAERAGNSPPLVCQSATLVLFELTICGRSWTNVSSGRRGLNPLGHSLKRFLSPLLSLFRFLKMVLTGRHSFCKVWVSQSLLLTLGMLFCLNMILIRILSLRFILRPRYVDVQLLWNTFFIGTALRLESTLLLGHKAVLGILGFLLPGGKGIFLVLSRENHLLLTPWWGQGDVDLGLPGIIGVLGLSHLFLDTKDLWICLDHLLLDWAKTPTLLLQFYLELCKQQGEMLQQLSKIIDNIMPKPSASAGLEDNSVVASSLGDEQSQSPDWIQLHAGDDEILDSDPEEHDMGKKNIVLERLFLTVIPFQTFALDYDNLFVLCQSWRLRKLLLLLWNSLRILQSRM